MLVVESEVEPVILSNGSRNRRFRCVCDCGKSIVAIYSALLSGLQTNCGCTPNYKSCPIDLSGYRFGKLTVLSEADTIYSSSGQKFRRWNCICDCGNTIIVQQRNLTCLKYAKSCGCLSRSSRKPKKSLVGNRYGLLTVVSASERKTRKDGRKEYTWLCQCDCGSMTVVCESNLVYGHTKSCGCLIGTTRKHTFSDLRGHRFGMLTVKTAIVPYKGKNGKIRRLYICLCDCGKEHVVEQCYLQYGKTNSCGCLNHRNLINSRFGHLTILSRNKTIQYKLNYNCLCDCGKKIVASFHDLYNSIITDCGCQAAQSAQEESCTDESNTDLTGQMFGMLTVTKKAPPLISPYRKKSHAWSCRCECGNQIIVRQERLIGKGAGSCGCIGVCL